MADVNISTNSVDYIKQVNDMVEANKRLVESLKEVGKLEKQLNDISESSKKENKKAGGIGNKASKNIKGIMKLLGFSINPSAKGSGLDQVFKDITYQFSSIIKSMFARASNSSITSKEGAKSTGGILGKLPKNVGDKIKSIFGTLTSSKTLKNLGKITLGVTALIGALTGLSALGASAYKSNIQLKNSLTQLGDGADYAFGYAKKLNEELNVPLRRSINNISALAASLKGAGGFSNQGASNIATQAYDLSYKLGLGYGIDPEAVYQDMQNAILNGENSLLQFNVQVSDEVLAGWLAATKGINMYATELSEGAKQAYRYQYIQIQLADVINNKQDLTNSTFARQLEIMNKLEDMGLKLKALFMPLFEWLVDNVKTVVDTVFNGINSILKLVGKDPIQYETKGLLNRNQDILSAIDNQNAAYRKQGELLKKNANQRLPFDEWISLEALQQLNEDLEKNTALTENFGENSGLEGSTDTSGLTEAERKAKRIQDFIDDASSKEISTYIKTTDKDGLMDLWDNFNFVEKGMYGTELGIQLIQKGEISKGIEALLYGAVGSFTGIEAIKDLLAGDYLGALNNGAQAISFVFGGWKGKVGAVVGELLEVSLGLLDVDDGLVNILSLVGTILTTLLGWKGAILAALTALGGFIGFKAGEAIGNAIYKDSDMNDKNSKKTQFAHLAARFGKNEESYYREQIELNDKKIQQTGVGEMYIRDYENPYDYKVKITDIYDYSTGKIKDDLSNVPKYNMKDSSIADIPKYASGGIALSPQLAEIGHGREAVIPLDSAEGMQFTRDLAANISENSDRDIYNDASRPGVIVEINAGTVVASEYSVRQFAERIRNAILDIDRMEGGAFSGTNQ